MADAASPGDERLEFGCVGLCEENAMTWMVEGRFNTNAEFEPVDMADAYCPECGELGEPTSEDVLADA